MTLNLHLVNGKVVGFYYPFRQCTKHFLFVCVKWELTSVDFDFDDQEKMKLFYDKDFVLKVRAKP